MNDQVTDLQRLYTEGKKLFEAARTSHVGGVPFEFHDAPPATHEFFDWIEENFAEVLAWLAQEPMAHQLADADQALTALEHERQLPHGHPDKESLDTHIARLRAAIDGTDYR